MSALSWAVLHATREPPPLGSKHSPRSIALRCTYRAQRTGSIALCCSFKSSRSRAPPSKNRKRINAGLRLFVCIRFQDLLHSPSGVLFAFPSRYWFAIGRSRVFSLGGWSPHVQTGFHVSRPTCRTPSSTPDLSSTGLSPTMAALSRAFD
jgi:hypothetical protein